MFILFKKTDIIRLFKKNIIPPSPLVSKHYKLYHLKVLIILLNRNIWLEFFYFIKIIICDLKRIAYKSGKPGMARSRQDCKSKPGSRANAKSVSFGLFRVQTLFIYKKKHFAHKTKQFCAFLCEILLQIITL